MCYPRTEVVCDGNRVQAFRHRSCGVLGLGPGMPRAAAPCEMVERSFRDPYVWTVNAHRAPMSFWLGVLVVPSAEYRGCPVCVARMRWCLIEFGVPGAINPLVISLSSVFAR